MNKFFEKVIKAYAKANVCIARSELYLHEAEREASK